VTGSISGIIGAGGNAGAVGFGFCFLAFDKKAALVVMGVVIIASSLLSVLVFIDGESSLLFGGDVSRKELNLSVSTEHSEESEQSSTNVTSKISDDPEP